MYIIFLYNILSPVPEHEGKFREKEEQIPLDYLGTKEYIKDIWIPVFCGLCLGQRTHP